MVSIVNLIIGDDERSSPGGFFFLMIDKVQFADKAFSGK